MGESKRKRQDEAQSPDNKRHRALRQSASAQSSPTSRQPSSHAIPQPSAFQSESRPMMRWRSSSGAVHTLREPAHLQDKAGPSHTQDAFAMDIEDTPEQGGHAEVLMDIERTNLSVGDREETSHTIPQQDVDMLSEAEDNTDNEDDIMDSEGDEMLSGLSEEQLHELRQFFTALSGGSGNG